MLRKTSVRPFSHCVHTSAGLTLQGLALNFSCLSRVIDSHSPLIIIIMIRIIIGITTITIIMVRIITKRRIRMIMIIEIDGRERTVALIE
jgi:hypothetical protein